MFVLSGHELKTAQAILLRHLPFIPEKTLCLFHSILYCSASCIDIFAGSFVSVQVQK